MIMGSSNKVRWNIPFKNFGRLRVKIVHSKLTLILLDLKVISLCHKYKIQASLHILTVYPGSILTDQLKMFSS